MSHRRTILGSLALAAALAGVGCTHNHYYYGPGFESVASAPTLVSSTPAVVASKPRKAGTAIISGTYCDVPTIAGSEPVIISSTPQLRGARPVITRSGSPPPVILSEGSGSAASDRWRRRSAESMATTRVTGSLDDELVR
ncbi:MAG: hypothetical protein KatS3mg108_3460 [Isosphaeraceae bacterium]|jgi:uncharacterized protein (DUF433 family)|nr:hypothetical protein [Bacillota bacterium]GIW89136.1 MAG: hypothetical protein KatS3mg108_3460 [Isosphaeraceae bacterium]